MLPHTNSTTDNKYIVNVNNQLMLSELTKTWILSLITQATVATSLQDLSYAKQLVQHMGSLPEAK